MHRYAVKQKPIQETRTAISATHVRAWPTQERTVRSILHLQRSIGNHAVQQILRGRSSLVAGPSLTLTGHTLKFYVLGPPSERSALSERFRISVQRLLPPGYIFNLTRQRPRDMQYEGYYRAELQEPANPTPSESWRENFVTVLRRCINGPDVQFRLQDGTAVMFGEYDPVLRRESALAPWSEPVAPQIGRRIPGVSGIIDVRDLENVNDEQLAANFLAHELEEQTARQAHGVTSFPSAHRVAVYGEAAFMGGRRRRSDREYATASRNAADPTSTWQWWIPYESPAPPDGDGSVLAAVINWQGSNIVDTRTETFVDIGAFEAAAGSAGLELIRTS